MTRKILILIFCLFSLNSFSQQTRFELMVLECLTAQIPPSDWEFIMNVFEDYITTHGIREENTSIEEGYVAYLKLRKSWIPFQPLIDERQAFKRRLYELNILGRNNLIGYPVLSCLSKIDANYRSEIESTQLGNIARFASILSYDSGFSLSPTLKNRALAYYLTADDFKSELYRKIIILLSFLDVIYLNEIAVNEIEPNNPIARMLNPQISAEEERRLSVESARSLGIDVIYLIEEYGYYPNSDDTIIEIIRIVEDEVKILDWMWRDDTRIEIIRIVEDDDIEIETIRIDVD